MHKTTPQTRVLLGRCHKLVGLIVFGVFLFITVFTVVIPQKATAAAPSTLNFQARLMTATGGIVPDGNYNVEFKLYNSATVVPTPDQGACTRNSGTAEPTCLWTETRTSGNVVQVKNGYLTVNLGSVTGFGSVDFSQQLWLTMRVGGIGAPSWDPEMNPRLLLTGVPYAFKAADSATLGGIASSGFIQNQLLSAQSANIFLQSGSSAGNPTVQVQQASGQTGDLLQFRNSSGTLIGKVDSSANIAVGNFVDIAGTGPFLNFGAGATILDTRAAGNTGLAIKGQSSQTGDLLQLQNNSGNAIAGFSSAGQLYLGRAGGSGVTGSLKLYNATNANTVAIQSGVTTTGYTLTLPTALGSSGNCLTDSTGTGVLAFSTCATASGATSVGALSNTSTANGGSISSGVLTLNVADGTNGGLLSAATNAQTIGGTKTFTGGITGTTITGTTLNATTGVNTGAGAGTSRLTSAGVLQNITGYTQSSGTATFNQGTGDQLLVTSGTNVPTSDQVNISNINSSGVATTGINALSIDYKGGAAAVEAAGARINLTPGGTSGGTWSAFRVVPNATGAVAGVTENGVKIDGITTPGSGSENAFYVGTNWDNILNYNGNSVINGTGVLQSFGLAGTYSQALTLSNAGNAISGVGTNLTALNASNLSSGTVATGLLSGSYTGITGTGALGAGSIGGSFGAISTGSNITTTTTLQGATVNATSGFQVGGVALASTNLSDSAGLARLSATQTFTGVNTFSNASNSFTGIGTGLTALNASNLASGTVSSSVVSGSYTGITGTGALAAGSIATGFGAISTANNITTTTTVQGATVNATSAYQFGGSTILTGSTLSFTSGPSSVTSAAGQTLSLNGATATNITTTAGDISLSAAGDLNLGSNAVNKTVTIGAAGSTANTTTVNVGTSTGAAQTINIGGLSTSGSSSNTATTINMQAGVTTLDLATAGATVQTYTNSTTAFQVLNANATPIFGVDTTLPTNLITNPGFEQGTINSTPTGWASKGSSTFTRQVSPPAGIYNGLSFGQAVLTNTGGASYNVGLTLSATYNLSFYARVASGTVRNLSVGYTNTGGDQDCLTSQTIVATGYTRFTCSFTVTTTAGTAIYFKTSTAGAPTIYVDGFQLLNGATNPNAYGLGTIQLRGIVNTPVALQNATNSTTAFQVLSTSGTAVLNVDTQNQNVITGNNGANSPWQSTTTPGVRFNTPIVYTNGYAYMVGGATAVGTSLATTSYAKVNANGSLGSWTATANNLSAAVGAQGAVAYNGYIYSIGGILSSGTIVNTVSYSKINADGNNQAWQTTTALPNNRWGGSAVVANGYIYYIGGQLTNSTAPLNTVYYAKINGDGTISATWTAGATLTNIRAFTSVVVVNNTLYVIGGDQGTGATTPQNTVYASVLNPDTGANAAFTTQTTTGLPSVAGGVAVAMNGYIYYYGGDNGSSGVTPTYYTKVNSNGTIGNWITSANALPTAATSTQGFTANGYMYIIGGATDQSDATPVSAAYYSSGPRVSIAGNLDLVGQQNVGQLNGAGGAGGSIYAGSVYAQGNLDVTGNSLLTGGLGVIGGTTFAGNVSINGFGLCVKVAAVKCSSTAAGQILSTSGSFTTADFAENYVSSQNLKPGDVVKLAKDGNNNAVVKTTSTNGYDILGVVSTAPGVTINSEAAADAAHPYVIPIALSGRVPVMVSNANGVVRAGDPLTASSVPGVAMKATGACYTLGRALEDSPITTDPNTASSVLGFIGLGYYDGTANGSDLQSSSTNTLEVTSSDPLHGAGSFTSIDVSGAATLASLNVASDANFEGNVTMGTAYVKGDLTIGGHLVTKGEAPTFLLQPYAGLMAPQLPASADPNAPVQHIAKATITGNDTSGKLTITIGDIDAAIQPGDVIKVTFNKAFGAEPQVIASPRGKDTAQAQFYVNEVSKDYFTIAAAGKLTPGATYTINYFSVQ